jgi:hypothetical protein
LDELAASLRKQQGSEPKTKSAGIMDNTPKKSTANKTIKQEKTIKEEKVKFEV